MAEIEATEITPKGVAFTDQLWAAAHDGASLLDLAQQLHDYGYPASDISELMDAVVILLAASTGVLIVDPADLEPVSD